MNRLSAVRSKLRRSRRKGSTHRLLFLDFDGVVNVPYDYDSPEFQEMEEKGEYDFFRPELVARVNRLCRDYGLSVVITSSWRYSGLDYCIDSLMRAGFDPAIEIEGMTDTDDPLFRREEEIFAYLMKTEAVSSFLILDDIPMEEFRDYAVATPFYSGYDEESDLQARKILDRQNHEKDSLWLEVKDEILRLFG